MATNYPTTIDAPTDPTPTTNTIAVSHAGQHSFANDAIVALETKVGVTGSADATSHDARIAALEAGGGGGGGGASVPTIRRIAALRAF